jgi:ABC-type transporter Mla subunit MlaD
VSSTISDVKSQLEEAFRRTEDVSGRLAGALVTIEEAQAIVLAATDGSAHSAVEQLTSALGQTRDTIEEAMSTLAAAVAEVRDYSAGL